MGPVNPAITPLNVKGSTTPLQPPPASQPSNRVAKDALRAVLGAFDPSAIEMGSTIQIAQEGTFGREFRAATARPIAGIDGKSDAVRDPVAIQLWMLNNIHCGAIPVGLPA